jgi:hypothetical protein
MSGLGDLETTTSNSEGLEQSLQFDNNIPLFDPVDNMFSPGQDMDWVCLIPPVLAITTSITNNQTSKLGITSSKTTQI